jgi:deoxyribose-phosphate aldolase
MSEYYGIAAFAATALLTGTALRMLKCKCTKGAKQPAIKRSSLRKSDLELSNLDEKSVDVASYIDHTVLKPSSVEADIIKLCAEAVKFKFAAVCVPPNFVKSAKSYTTGSNVGVATVIGFPFGYSCIDAKVAEVELAIEDGADELDMVANISAIKSKNWTLLKEEVDRVIAPIRASGRVLKVIIESGILTDEEIIGCCRVYAAAGIDYLKTSTGYAESGASVHAVSLFRANLPASVEIKASGGIRDYATAMAMIKAGATRIGCSAGVAIVTSAPSTPSAGGY